MKFIYQVLTTITGFLLHPYPTMQKVVDQDVPMLYVFFPFVLCLLGWWVARTFVGFFLSLLPLLGVWWFLEVWWLVFWASWQLILLYLYLRFRSIKSK